MRAFVNFLIFLAVLTPSVASGQTYTRYRLPAGVRLSVASRTYQAYTLGEYRELLQIDEDLHNLTELHDADLARITALETASTELRQALTACSDQLPILETERTRLTNLWQEESRRRHELEQASSWQWVPWAIAGGFFISTVVLSVIVGVSR